MKIDLKNIKMVELVNGYKVEGGVRGYGGRLNIRPTFRREYVPDAQYSAILLGAS